MSRLDCWQCIRSKKNFYFLRNHPLWLCQKLMQIIWALLLLHRSRKNEHIILRSIIMGFYTTLTRRYKTYWKSFLTRIWLKMWFFASTSSIVGGLDDSRWYGAPAYAFNSVDGKSKYVAIYLKKQHCIPKHLERAWKIHSLTQVVKATALWIGVVRFLHWDNWKHTSYKTDRNARHVSIAVHSDKNNLLCPSNVKELILNNRPQFRFHIAKPVPTEFFSKFYQ